jgi:hypothetical protein
VNDHVNLNPVITPVLDLTNVKSSAAQLGGMLSITPIRVTASASAAARGFQDNLDAQTMIPADGTTPAGDTIYNQYNNSPAALSTADIYRQTKNQLSAKKGELP